MTQEEFDKAPLLDQILYDTTGMLVENHPSLAESMEKYHQAKLKLLLADVSQQRELFVSFARFAHNYGKRSYGTSYEKMFSEWLEKRNK